MIQTVKKGIAERLHGGIGKPEPLSGILLGEYSCRINEKDRLVCHMENGQIYIAHSRGHYGDK